MADMKHSNIAGSYGQVSGEVPLSMWYTVQQQWFVYTVEEASSGSMWPSYYLQVSQMTGLSFFTE